MDAGGAHLIGYFSKVRGCLLLLAPFAGFAIRMCRCCYCWPAARYMSSTQSQRSRVRRSGAFLQLFACLRKKYLCRATILLGEAIAAVVAALTMDTVSAASAGYCINQQALIQPRISNIFAHIFSGLRTIQHQQEIRSNKSYDASSSSQEYQLCR